MSVTYHVQAKPWAQGWELHIENVGVTQAETLTRAEQTVRDYLATLLSVHEAEVTVESTQVGRRREGAR